MFPQLYLSYERSLFIGRLPKVLQANNGSSALIVSLDQPIRLSERCGSQQFENYSFLVPVAKNVDIDTGESTVAIILLDYLGKDFSSLVGDMESEVLYKVYQGFNKTNDLKCALRELHARRPAAEVVFSQLDQFISNENNAVRFSDERVDKAVELIRTNIGSDFSIAEIAEHVSLSIPRLTQLFRQVTGINVRRFKMWHRIYVTSVLCAQGMTLTEAAITAGFSDYAHFSRSFSEMTGISPSFVLSKKYNAYIDVLPTMRLTNAFMSLSD